MAYRLALAYFSLAPPLVLASFWVDHPVAIWVFAAAIGPAPVAMTALGVGPDRPLGRLALPLAALLLILEGGLAALLATSNAPGGGPWFGGLPLPGAVMIYGMWLLPFAITPSLYAWTFGEHGLTPADLERVRAQRLDAS